MKYSRGTLKRAKQFHIEKMRLRITRIENMIRQFEQAETEMAHEVARLEHTTGKLDPADVTYPLLAKAVIQRRANIQRSVVELRRELDETKQAMAEALSELEQIERVEQHHQGYLTEVATITQSAPNTVTPA